MSSRYAPVDEVRVLSGGSDVFEMLYARARAAYPRGIWVEAFGVVKGASIIELVGDRHRESVREATLSQMSATVFHDGETPDIRSVATLTWREKRNPRSLTGFLASALATHVTLRIREIEFVTGAPEDAVPTIGLGGPAPRPSDRAPKAAAPAPARASVPKAASKPAPKAAPAHPPAELDLFDASASPKAVAPAVEDVSWDTLAEASTAAPDDAIGWDALAAATSPSSGGGAGAPPEKGARQEKAAETKVARKTEAEAQLEAAWGEVAQVSLEVGLRPATAASALKRGEVLVHPTLGSCTILSVVSETVVMVKPKGQPSKKISLKPFEIFATPKSGVYELERR